jgi:uncharacterized protein
MLTGQLPRFVDPRKLAKQDGEIRGETTVGELPRLREFENSLEERVEVHLRFFQDELGYHVVEGIIETRLALRCQRCLEPVDWPIEVEVSLGMAWGEDQMKALPDAYDPWLITSDQMPLAELIEEEILLALPAVTLHEACPHALFEDNAQDPTDEPADPEDEDENPFAVLAQLKKQDPDE